MCIRCTFYNPEAKEKCELLGSNERMMTVLRPDFTYTTLIDTI